MLRDLLEGNGNGEKIWADAIKKAGFTHSLFVVERPSAKDADGCYFSVVFEVNNLEDLSDLIECIKNLNKILDFDKLNDCDEDSDSVEFEFEGSNLVKVWFWSGCNCK